LVERLVREQIQTPASGSKRRCSEVIHVRTIRQTSVQITLQIATLLQTPIADFGTAETMFV
jgi:hypothetical protein